MTARKLIILAVLFFISCIASAQQLNPEFDSLLAKKLNADERGMKLYILAILETDADTIKDKHLRDSLFQGHFDNIKRMVSAKQLVVAGPLEKNDLSYRGIFILNVTDFEKAREILAHDPAISNHIFKVEYLHWYGSAALSEYLEADKKIHKYLHE